jgi:hypothetical protein
MSNLQAIECVAHSMQNTLKGSFVHTTTSGRYSETLLKTTTTAACCALNIYPTHVLTGLRFKLSLYIP